MMVIVSMGAEPSADTFASFVWLLGLLVAITLGTTISVVLLMRILRRRHQPASPRKASRRDAWLESGRRLDVDDHE